MNWSAARHDLYNTLDSLEVGGYEPGAGGLDAAFARWRDLAQRVRENDRTIYLLGNGASASMASHFAADLSKNAGVRTKVFTDLSEITAIGNDIGFEHIYSLPLSRYARKGDLLIAISSSGRSPNILAAVSAAREKELTIVTLSGFDPKNPLRAGGDVNFYVPAASYGLVESCHAFILHYWMDSVAVGYKAERG